MIHLQLTTKALGHNRLEAGEDADPPTRGIYFRQWYVDVIGTGTAGKFVTIFLHPESLLTLVVPGKSLRRNFTDFQERLIQTLQNIGVDKTHILAEIQALQDSCILEADNEKNIKTAANIIARLKPLLPLSPEDTSKKDWDKLHQHLLDHSAEYAGKKSAVSARESIHHHFQKS